jgi:hypothetical protein
MVYWYNQASIYVTVFSAARTSPLISASNPVRYDVVLVDTAAGFNTDKTTYTVQSPGVYFIHMSAGVPPYQRLNYFLQGGTSTPNLVLNHTTFDGELVTSRDDIQFLGEGQTLYVSSDYPLYSDAMMQTSLSGFRLDNMMSKLVVFRAARTSPQFDAGRMVLDKLIINIGGGWDECNNRFVAPTADIYFFSWSASNSSPDKKLIIYLNVNGNNFTENIIFSGSYPGSDTTTQSLLLRLNAGDIVYLVIGLAGSSGLPIYSDNNYQMSFVGFLYDPISVRPIAWTLALYATSLDGPAIVNFTEVVVNEGSVWDATAAALRIPQTGTYYLKISGVSSHIPVPGQYKFNLGLIVNGELLTNTIEQIDSVKTDAFNLRSRALITQLQAGDVVEVGVPAGYNVGSNYNRQTIFSGFLIV